MDGDKKPKAKEDKKPVVKQLKPQERNRVACQALQYLLSGEGREVNEMYLAKYLKEANEGDVIVRFKKARGGFNPRTILRYIEHLVYERFTKVQWKSKSHEEKTAVYRQIASEN